MNIRWIFKKNIHPYKIVKLTYGTVNLCIANKQSFKVQTHQRKSCPHPSPALSADWSPSTVCPLCSVGTLPPGKWYCTIPGRLYSWPRAQTSDTLTSRRSSERPCCLWSQSNARSCGWEAWGLFRPSPSQGRCRILERTPGCRRSTGQFWGWWWSCLPVGSHPEQMPGLDHSSTPTGL